MKHSTRLFTFVHVCTLRPNNCSRLYMFVHLDPIIKIQKKIVRTITLSHHLAHTVPLFDTLNILNFNNLVVHRICLMMFKYSKEVVLLPIVELFTRNYELHNHYTRQSQSLNTAVGRNEAIYKIFTFHGIRIWNYVSTKISVDISYASYKHSSKLFIKNNSIPYGVIIISCHQTVFFHLSAHSLPVSLNSRRSSKVQGRVRSEHCNKCAVFSVASPHTHVVSPS